MADSTPGDQHEADLSRAELAAIVESSDDVIVSKTLEGVIKSWNAAAERLFGWTAAEAVGQHITLIIPPERRAEEDDVIARIRAGERVDHFETIRVTKDGQLRAVSITVSPIRDAAGRVVGASKIARDITERRRLEEERASMLAREQEARQQAENLNRAKDQLLATVSHVWLYRQRRRAPGRARVGDRISAETLHGGHPDPEGAGHPRYVRRQVGIARVGTSRIPKPLA